ncbi:MAG: hypothetical protein IJZ15_04160 [Oscillospiraceae bacterium]|nr:hypothetical protein [Oscillospiraceae bacterium]
MGGRGASSGISNAGKPYGTEYKTLLKHGNIKFVRRNEGAANAPMETMTKGRVYVTVNSANEPRFISYYDNANKRKKTIDLGKDHHGIIPHVHHGYNHNELDGINGATRLTKKEKEMVVKVKQLWYTNNSK